MRGTWLVAALLAFGVSPVQAQSAIYRCTSEAGTVFSDRPCGPHAAPVTLDDSRLSTFAPVPVTKRVTGKVDASKPSKSASRTVRQSRGKAAGSESERCVRIRASLREIDDRFRAGYSAKEGIRLDERKRNLRQQARELKC